MGLDFSDVGAEDNKVGDSVFCVVGRFADDRDVNIEALQHTLASIWRLVKKMVVSRASSGRLVFQFFHEKDLKRVLEDGPWTFKGQLLLLKKLEVG